MSRDSLKGNAPVTMVTSVPWKRERDITVIAVIAASSAKRRSVQILTYCRGRCIYTASRARHICMLRDNWPVIDWREPIGLQERLEGRSSHNGVISVMSRSRFQGTEVTIVTGAFYSRIIKRSLALTCIRHRLQHAVFLVRCVFEWCKHFASSLRARGSGK